MPTTKSAKAMSGEAACPRCGCPVFEAEKMIAANKVRQEADHKGRPPSAPGQSNSLTLGGGGLLV